MHPFVTDCVNVWFHTCVFYMHNIEVKAEIVTFIQLLSNIFSKLIEVS